MSRFQRFRRSGRLVISTTGLLTAGLIAIGSAAAVASAPAPADRLLAAGSEQFTRGATGDAIGSWREARRLYKAAGQKQGEIDALADLASAYQYTGDYAAPVTGGLPELIVNPLRPGRYHPRVKKRRMKEYDLMNKPRAEYAEPSEDATVEA